MASSAEKSIGNDDHIFEKQDLPPFDIEEDDGGNLLMRRQKSTVYEIDNEKALQGKFKIKISKSTEIPQQNNLSGMLSENNEKRNFENPDGLIKLN